jgi:hypothetical protein
VRCSAGGRRPALQKHQSRKTKKMTRYVGLDVHREVLVACVIDSEGRCLERYRIELSRSNLERFAKERLRPGDRVALEATTNTWAVDRKTFLYTSSNIRKYCEFCKQAPIISPGTRQEYSPRLGCHRIDRCFNFLCKSNTSPRIGKQCKTWADKVSFSSVFVLLGA